MKILTPQEFIKQPNGTVYIKYTPHTFIDQISIKAESRGEKSWWTTTLLPWVGCDSDAEQHDILSNWEKHNDIPTQEFCTDDAIYNHNEILYVVVDKNEVREMIDRLVESLII